MLVERARLGLQGIGELGDSCPSTEQLQGIQDCTDPCQAPYSPCAEAVPGIPAMQGTVASLPMSDLLTVNTQGQPVSPAYGINVGLSPSLVVVSVGVVFIFLMMLRK
jgi:hypothetical protein